MKFASTDLLFQVPRLIADHQLALAIHDLRMFVEDHPSEGAADAVNAIGNDYQLMLNYARQGYQDPTREQLYKHLQQRLQRLCLSLQIRHWIEKLSFFRNADMGTGAVRQLTPIRIKEQLEGFVSELAMLSLEPDEVRQERAKEVHRLHQEFLACLFNRLVVDRPWSVTDQQYYEDLFLSPTLDRLDVLLMVSAVTLSVLQTFDLHKFTSLLHVYQHSTDPYIRQRALVGWVFALQSDDHLTDEPQTLVQEACRDAQVVQDVIGLQKQLVFCIHTQQDNEEIQKEIIPTLMKNNNFTISRDGIISEKEDDVMENILNPDADEQRMEEVENSIHKMMEMQKAGSDIYFSGFSQMKRFPFFYKAANWFCPFYPEHPAIAKVTEKLGPYGFMSNLVQFGPFCDSDKYSFTLAMSSIVDRLPDNLKEMMGNAEALGPVMEEQQRQDAAYIRRMYLQDLYRFYTLNDTAVGLVNPFEHDRFVVIDNEAFLHTDVARRYPELCLFFIKNHCDDAFKQLQEKSMPYLNVSQRLAYAAWFLESGQSATQAVRLLEEVMAEDPDNEQVNRYMARAYYAEKDYVRACMTYEKLHRQHPEKPSYALNYGITLSKNERFEEAVQVLYQLDFEHPSQHVTRGLAWALMGQQKLEQAEREYNKLLASSPATIDYLNAGYCQWFKGNTYQAVALFRTFLEQHRHVGNGIDLRKEMDNDLPMLRSYGITDIDKGILCDLVME